MSEKVCNVKYIITLEWADEETEEIARIASKILCCQCDDENGNGDDD